MNEIEFRTQLENITKCRGETKQEKLIEDLSLRYPHSIKKHEDKSVIESSLEYNCFNYALNLFRSLLLREGVTKKDLFPDCEFVRFCIEKIRLAEIPFKAVKNDDLIIYFDSGAQPKHAGTMRNMRVVSKWGHGNLWEHATWEVPISYGNNVRYFAAIEDEEVLKHYLEFLNK